MAVVVMSGRQKKSVWIYSRNKKCLSCSKKSTLAQMSLQFLIQRIPGSLLAAVRWPGLEAGQLLSIYDIVSMLQYMMLYLQSSTCHDVVLNETQGHSLAIVMI